MIKKYNTQKVEVSLNDQLQAYQQQAKVYRQSSSQLKRNLKKGTLAALIPLAAVSVANAQCQGAQATVTLASGNKHSFDIDGGGTDFKMRNPGTEWQIRGIGSNQIIADGPNVKRLNKSYAVTTGKAFGGSGYLGLCLQDGTAGSGPFNATNGVAPNNFIGIKKGTKLGFIQLTTNACFNGNTNVIFKINEMGYENDGNSAVTTSDCATLVLLSVDLSYFSSKITDNHIQLNWATSSETNNSGYEIQRSTDGRLYHKIGWVAGNGTTQDEQEYNFIDENVKANVTYYYRLKQVDFDGTFEFSAIESNLIKNADLIEVGDFYPNPITKDFPVAWINLNIPNSVDGLMQVFDARGQLVTTFEKHFDAGQNRFSLRLENLTAGQYFVKLQVGEKHEYRKLIVK